MKNSTQNITGSLLSFLKMFVFFICSGLIFVVILYMVFNASDKEMMMRCHQYEQYAKDFPEFWMSAHDKVECDRLGIEVKTTVR